MRIEVSLLTLLDIDPSDFYNCNGKETNQGVSNHGYSRIYQMKIY